MKTIKGVVIGAFALLFASAVPTFSQNALQFTSVNVTDEGAIQLHWASTNHEVYQIQYAGVLNGNDDGSTAWQILYDYYPSQGTNTFGWIREIISVCRPFFIPKKMPMRFYRIVDRGPDDLINDEPTVSIVFPTNGSVVSDLLTVTVTASTDQ